MSNCPGPCNAAHRKAEEAYRAAVAGHMNRVLGGEDSDPPQPHTLRPEPGQPVWCRRCASIIRACLAELDDLTAILEAEVAGKRGQAGDKVSGSAGSPSPAPKADDVDEILTTLEEWEQAYRDLRQWPARPLRGRTAPRGIGCVSWLTRHLDGILGSPMAVDFGAEILRLHRMAQEASRTSPDTVRKPIPCPRCNRRSLIHKGGDKHVKCEVDTCGRLLTLQEYDDMVAATARAVS
jgi:hypothetical protein